MADPFVAEIRIFPFNFGRSRRTRPSSRCWGRPTAEMASRTLPCPTSKAVRRCIRVKVRA
jgi:hypothetical protein